MHEISGYSKLEALDKGKVFLLCLSLSPTTGHKRHILENVGLGEPAPSNQRGEAYNFKAVSTITKRNTERGSYIHALWKTDRERQGLRDRERERNKRESKEREKE